MALVYSNFRCWPIRDVSVKPNKLKGLLVQEQVTGDDVVHGFVFPSTLDKIRTIDSYLNGKATILRWLTVYNGASAADSPVYSFPLSHQRPESGFTPVYLDTVVSMGYMSPMRYPIDLPCSGDLWMAYDYLTRYFLYCAGSVIESTDTLITTVFFEVI